MKLVAKGHKLELPKSFIVRKINTKGSFPKKTQEIIQVSPNDLSNKVSLFMSRLQEQKAMLSHPISLPQKSQIKKP